MSRLKKLRLVLSLLLLIAGTEISFAQQFGQHVVAHSSEQKTSTKKEDSGFKPDVRISLGTFFSTFGPGLNTFGTYLAPEVSFPVTKKFSIQTGIGYSNLFNNQAEGNRLGNKPAQYGSIYVSGTYLVNDKLSIRGTGYKTFLLNPPSAENKNNMPDFRNQGVAFDVNYNITENFHINARFQYRQQNSPDYYFGYPQSGFETPAYTSPFNHGFGNSGYGF